MLSVVKDGDVDSLSKILHFQELMTEDRRNWDVQGHGVTEASAAGDDFDRPTTDAQRVWPALCAALSGAANGSEPDGRAAPKAGRGAGQEGCSPGSLLSLFYLLLASYQG